MLGANNPRLDIVRSLLTKKGRREHGKFAIEGPTMLAEAIRSGVAIEEVYGTAAALEAFQTREPLGGIRAYQLDERTMRRLSGLETPPGLVAVARVVLHDVATIFSEPGLVLALAGVSDPGNAGTLLRTAEAFGVGRVLFESGSVEPYAPKVVRAAMGSIFRLRLAVASAAAAAAAARGWEITGLDAAGEAVTSLRWSLKAVLVVGQERHGLGGWRPFCSRLAGIPMTGAAESLNASVAGGIALYEATKNARQEPVKRV